MSKSESSGCWWRPTPEKAVLLMAWIKGIGQSGTASGVPITTRERGDSSLHHLLLWAVVLLIPISVNTSKQLHVRARLKQ